ncbi:hypothetical protein DZC18_002241 [Clostridium beijerinckii]|nr:hypothetical protein [Clostridium beijerinckii]NSA87698.1 hypothetical protein [Clostridium beijerinckii]
MFKRANKITSLLVAAASVMSLVPAYAADVKKLIQMMVLYTMQ